MKTGQGERDDLDDLDEALAAVAPGSPGAEAFSASLEPLAALPGVEEDDERIQTGIFIRAKSIADALYSADGFGPYLDEAMRMMSSSERAEVHMTAITYAVEAARAQTAVAMASTYLGDRQMADSCLPAALAWSRQDEAAAVVQATARSASGAAYDFYSTARLTPQMVIEATSRESLAADLAWDLSAHFATFGERWAGDPRFSASDRDDLLDEARVVMGAFSSPGRNVGDGDSHDRFRHASGSLAAAVAAERAAAAVEALKARIERSDGGIGY